MSEGAPGATFFDLFHDLLPSLRREHRRGLLLSCQVEPQSERACPSPALVAFLPISLTVRSPTGTCPRLRSSHFCASSPSYNEYRITRNACAPRVRTMTFVRPSAPRGALTLKANLLLSPNPPFNSLPLPP